MSCSDGNCSRPGAQSAWVCGCDPGANWSCDHYPNCAYGKSLQPPQSRNYVCGCDSQGKWHCGDYPLCAFGRAEDYDGPDAGPMTEPADDPTVPDDGGIVPLASRIQCVMRLVERELVRAIAMHPTGMMSLHEALAIIEEENPNKFPSRTIDAKMEAVQVAAMAARLLLDIE